MTATWKTTNSGACGRKGLPLQDAIELALLTGQRPADVLKLTRADVGDGALHLKQNKTDKKLAIEIAGELAQMIERITSRPAKIKGTSLIQGESGQLRDDGAGSWAISIV